MIVEQEVITTEERITVQQRQRRQDVPRAVIQKKIEYIDREVQVPREVPVDVDLIEKVRVLFLLGDWRWDVMVEIEMIDRDRGDGDGALQLRGHVA
eukprot:314213-Rhodomonas_salina.4